MVAAALIVNCRLSVLPILTEGQVLADLRFATNTSALPHNLLTTLCLLNVARLGIMVRLHTISALAPTNLITGTQVAAQCAEGGRHSCMVS